MPGAPSGAGCFLLPQGKHQWTTKGAQHVESPLKDDKRQFTSAFWASAAGKIIFMDFITTGKTDRSLPLLSVRQRFPRFLYACTPNHWANCESKKRSVMRLWEHAVKAYAEKHGMSMDVARTRTKILLLIDCWPVNLSAEFKEWVRTNCPGIRILYIPAGATGQFQVRGKSSSSVTTQRPATTRERATTTPSTAHPPPASPHPAPPRHSCTAR